MNKNIIIPIIIAVIIIGLIFVLAQHYAAQEQRRTVEIITPASPVKPPMKPATSTQQEIQNIDIGDMGNDFKAVDANINSL